MVIPTSHFHAVYVFLSKALAFLLPTLVLLSSTTYSAHLGYVNHIKSATFVSEKIELGPGRIASKNLIDIEFPRGHIGVKSFEAELVDEEGNSVPLYETYLHHWFAMKYIQPKNISHNKNLEGAEFKRNAGTCNTYFLPHHWGMGGESRGTPSKLPDPFSYELGNPASIPPGYEEKWMFNTLAIDTRGAKHKKGCSECRCDLLNLPKDFYNKATDLNGKPLDRSYKGGMYCCQDGLQCELKKGFQAPTRKLSLRYKITWVDWNEFQVPVKFYVLDSTDRVRRNGSTIIHDCQVEYNIPKRKDGSKYHVQKANIPMEKGGYLIYCTSHMHTGVVNATLYGQDGRILCTSIPKYGKGKEPGNEKGYAIGMSVVYPEPGSIRIKDGETVTVESIYKNVFRTGAMGQMSIYLAEKLSR